MSPGAQIGAQHIRQILGAILERDPRAMVVSEATDGIAGSLRGLSARYPERVLQVPIAERGALGLALGLALGGRPTAVEVAGTSQLRSALEPLAEAGAIAQAGEFPVPLCVRVPFGTAMDGTYAPGHDVSLGGWLLDLPGVEVVCPSTLGQLAAWLRKALQGSTPTVLLEPMGLYTRSEALADEPARASHRHREGQHVTLAAVGGTVEVALRAAEELLQEGIEPEILELIRLSPLEVEPLGASVRRTGRLVVVHPEPSDNERASAQPALVQYVRNVALDQGFWWLEAPLAQASAASSEASSQGSARQGTDGARAVVDAARGTLIA